MRLLIAERFTPVPSSFSLLFNSSSEEIEDFAKTFRKSIYRFLKLSTFLTADESLTKCSRDYSTKRQDALVLPGGFRLCGAGKSGLKLDASTREVRILPSALCAGPQQHETADQPKGVLFTCGDTPFDGALSAKNNQIEDATNAPLRHMLRDHRRMRPTRRIKAVFWWCAACTPKTRFHQHNSSRSCPQTPRSKPNGNTPHKLTPPLASSPAGATPSPGTNSTTPAPAETAETNPRPAPFVL